VLSKEVASFGITVNVLGLSIVDGPGMAEQISEEAISETLGRTAIGRKLSQSDITNAADFLISEGSGAVTSQTIYLGGP
jgi:NAD(P)-dependent dehydrogenase (short-subunit alcohol dehydrogenase family)